MQTPEFGRLSANKSLAFLSTFLLATSLAQAEPLANLYSREGVVTGRIAPQTVFTNLETGAEFQEQDSVRTAAKSRAALRFFDGIFVRLNENSQLTVKGQAKADRSLELSSGLGYFFSRDSHQFPTVKTPVVTAALRGTEFVIETTVDRSVVSVLEGSVECSNQFGSVVLAPGEQAITERGRAPVKAIMVRPQNAVSWALYYPAFLDPRDFADVLEAASTEQRASMNALANGDTYVAFSGSDAVSIFGRALREYQMGNTTAAFTLLNSLPANRPPGMLLFEAALDLSVGQLAEANALHSRIEQRISSAPESTRSSLLSALNAQRAIIALINNLPEDSEKFAKQAQHQSDSLSAAIASSYVLQSQFQLDSAIGTLQMRNDATLSSFARARLAELHLSTGNVEEALEILAKINQSNQENAYVLTLKGFAKLMRLEVDDGIGNFELAAKREPAWGLPQLGWGLGLIRNGQLEEGRHHLEMAVHLEPNVSLYRSYLGKAYFEEERQDTSLREYNRAIELDPKDPTPYLYRSFSHSALNQPVLALQDIEDSIERNNNRAVYRSRLGLDQDLAVRTSGLGGVFNGLGFADAGRIEALKSINKSYINQAGHYLLADSSTSQPIFSQAEGSETLIGRLLSPVNFNSLARGASVVGGGLNEYSSLFDRPVSRAYFKNSTDTRRRLTDSTLSGSASFGRWGVASSYENFYSDGYRDNDFKRFNVLTTSIQGALTPNDFLLTDFGVNFTNSGDTSIGTEPNENNPDESSYGFLSLARLGYRRTISPNATFLAQVAQEYGSSDTKIGGLFSPIECQPDFIELFGDPGDCNAVTNTIAIRRFGPSVRGDTQLIWENSWVTSILGNGLQNSDLTQEQQPVGGTLTGIGGYDRSTSDLNTRSLYEYLTVRPFERLELSAGANYTSTEYVLTRVAHVEKTTPRFALALYPADSVVLRAAYFQLLALEYSTDTLLIEPTNIGLFDQLYYDRAGSESENYAAGVDMKFAKRLYFGIEGLHRYFAQVPVTFEPEEHNRLSGYVSGIISDTAVSTLRYEWYRKEQFLSRFAPEIGRHDVRTDTHKISQELRYFQPNGWFGFLNATWRDQDRDDANQAFLGRKFDGTEDFLIMNATVGYLLEKRAGQLSFSVENLFDRHFVYETLPTENPVLPDLTFVLRISLNI